MRISFKSFNEPKVTDENGKEIISFEKSKSLPTRVCYSVIDANHEKIGKIERIRNNFGLFNLPEIVISVKGDKIIVRKDIKEMQNIYEIMGNDFSIIGKLDGPNFNITKSENVLVSVEVQKEESGDSYLVEIIEESNMEQVICILFALSWIL